MIYIYFQTSNDITVLMKMNIIFLQLPTRTKHSRKEMAECVSGYTLLANFSNMIPNPTDVIGVDVNKYFHSLFIHT